MLETLRIQNYALIDDVELEFGPGFTVLTGETGAGKSIIIGALNLVLGTRAAGDSIRSGAAKAAIDAIFLLKKPSRRLQQLLDEHQVELEDGALIVSRVITRDGRSRAHLGGVAVPLSVLAAVGDELVDLHGQHEHQSLLKAERHLELLDGFGNLEADADALGAGVSQLRELARDIHELEHHDRERARQVEFLRFALSEIDGAELSPGEEEDLRARRNLITNAERVFELSQSAYAALHEGDEVSAVDLAGVALTNLEALAAIDGQFQPMAEQLQAIQGSLDELARDLQRATENIEYDPDELNRLNERLTLIADLKRKYGDTVADILDYRDNALEQIQRFDTRDKRLESLRHEHAQLAVQVMARARQLSDARRSAAEKLDKKILAALKALDMKGGQFQTRLAEGELTRSGIDRVEFYLAANPGEKPKPLRQVASGGEISRIMLALKATFAGADKIPTLVFDEIDAGVGGAVATKVAAKLRALAGSHQVVCITHLPQIAAAADCHYNVAKTVAGKRTSTAVTQVEHQHRISEIARLLDGSVSPVSLEHARALLSQHAERVSQA
jgi:DNA repair protein RecN (Recombination protein N)